MLNNVAANVSIFMKTYFVYIMASCKNGTLYIGVTNNFAKRAWEHKIKLTKSFTSKYNIRGC